MSKTITTGSGPYSLPAPLRSKVSRDVAGLEGETLVPPTPCPSLCRPHLGWWEAMKEEELKTQVGLNKA